MRGTNILLVVLGAAALAALALPWVGTIAAITFIGLPLALAYWAAPAVFLFGLMLTLFTFVSLQTGINKHMRYSNTFLESDFMSWGSALRAPIKRDGFRKNARSI